MKAEKQNHPFAEIVAGIRENCDRERTLVFVSGNFNVVHPGHLRLLNFAAENGDFLVVGVLADNLGNSLLPEDLRLEGIASIGMVDYCFILREPPEQIIKELQPQLVVKGREYSKKFNPEADTVSAYGGKLLFSSGEVRFSSFDLIQKELFEEKRVHINHSQNYLERHNFKTGELIPLILRVSELKIVVIGDLIVDEYVTCDPLGMSQEDPTIVVTPIEHDQFVGGAGIVAAHARGLGAQVQFFSVAGDDEPGQFARSKLTDYGVDFKVLTDSTRPTTLKQRFRANGKTLLRVNHLRQHEIDEELMEEMFSLARPAIEQADLLMFSDFNYGCLPQPLVEKITAHCKRHEVMLAADSQSSSQVGDISRFKGTHLITPTEHEARLAMRDSKTGLVMLADNLQRETNCPNVIITLGREGILIHTPPGDRKLLFTDRLPAFNSNPSDVSGAGDSLVICTAIGMAVGLNIWQASYLGSVAAALQVSRVGNTPLNRESLIEAVQ